MKGETKKNILKFTSLYIFVLIILVATISLVIYLSRIYLEIINYNLDLLDVINVSLITILVLITGAYGYFTWKIVDETRNDRRISQIERKIKFTEHQLRDFYYPLENFLKRYFSYREKTNNPKDKPVPYLHVTSDLHNTKTRNELLEYEYIIKNKYLATEDILDNLYDFLDEKNISRQKITDANILSLYDNLIIDVDKKTIYLNEKLSNLIKELAGY